MNKKEKKALINRFYKLVEESSKLNRKRCELNAKSKEVDEGVANDLTMEAYLIGRELQHLYTRRRELAEVMDLLGIEVEEA